MGLLQKLIIGVMVCLPATAWSADLHYALDVKINTSEQKISGIARLISDADTKNYSFRAKSAQAESGWQGCCCR